MVVLVWETAGESPEPQVDRGREPKRARDTVAPMTELHRRLVDRILDPDFLAELEARSIDDLRARDTGVVIDVDGPPPGWAVGLPGVQVLDSPGTAVRLRLAPETDDQTVLKAALAAGPVHEFRRWRPPLTELYRDVVQSSVPAAAVAS